MKNNKKKSSTAKKLMPAFAMLTVSAMTLASSTYAWFTMSDTVSVTGMQMKATSESGLIIRNELVDTWSTQVQASYSGLNKAVLPTSTANTTNWYYRMSSQFDNAEANQASTAYTSLNSLTDVQEGVSGDAADGVFGVTTNGNTQNYYLLNKFYIKSSGQALTDKNVTITSVKATAPETQASANLNKAFRVAVKIGGDVYIYAPFSDNLSYHVGGYTTNETTFTADVTAIKPGTDGALGTPSVADDATIPANTATVAGDTTTNPVIPKAIEADVYLYFEGEDPACKSSNIGASFDALSVEITFGMANVANNNAQQGNGATG
jgi:hypothetical protein